MTVKKLKEILETYNDNDRIIVDRADPMNRHEASEENEVVLAYSILKNDDEQAPIVILQTRSDFDVESELRARLEHYSENVFDEQEAITELYELGFNENDFLFDDGLYEWARINFENYGCSKN